MMRPFYSLFRFFLIFNCCIGLFACTSSISYREKAFIDLLQECKEEGKYLFLYLYNEGCPACEQADRVLVSSQLSELLQKDFICTKKNRYDEFWVAQVFYAASTPTFIILNGEGKIFYIQAGFTTEAGFRQVLTDIAGHRKPVYPSYTPPLYTSGKKLYELFEPVLNAWILQNSLNETLVDPAEVKLLLVAGAFMAFDYGYRSDETCYGPCQNGGIKKADGSCYCMNGYWGACCELPDPCPNCSFHGRKDGGRCVCDLGWGGDCCEERWLAQRPIQCNVKMTLDAEAIAKLKRFATVSGTGSGQVIITGELGYTCVSEPGGGLIECSPKDCATAIHEIIN